MPAKGCLRPISMLAKPPSQHGSKVPRSRADLPPSCWNWWSAKGWTCWRDDGGGDGRSGDFQDDSTVVALFPARPGLCHRLPGGLAAPGGAPGFLLFLLKGRPYQVPNRGVLSRFPRPTYEPPCAPAGFPQRCHERAPYIATVSQGIATVRKTPREPAIIDCRI
jgi:hypothetical protein